MTPTITTVQDAIDLLANCPMTLDELFFQVNAYLWFIAVIRARYGMELADSTGCLDSGLL